MTGFSKAVRELVWDRAQGRCENCGRQPVADSALCMQFHHRRPRAMGGSSRLDTNTASNCLLLCALCHERVESRRTEARSKGLLVAQHRSPQTTPVCRRGTWYILSDDGDMMPIPEPQGLIA